MSVDLSTARHVTDVHHKLSTATDNMFCTCGARILKNRKYVHLDMVVDGNNEQEDLCLHCWSGEVKR